MATPYAYWMAEYGDTNKIIPINSFILRLNSVLLFDPTITTSDYTNVHIFMYITLDHLHSTPVTQVCYNDWCWLANFICAYISFETFIYTIVSLVKSKKCNFTINRQDAIQKLINSCNTNDYIVGAYDNKLVVYSRKGRQCVMQFICDHQTNKPISLQKFIELYQCDTSNSYNISPSIVDHVLTRSKTSSLPTKKQVQFGDQYMYY